MNRGLQIGELARRTRVSVDTVRYYERRHLLPRAHRSEGGFRIFTADSVERVTFIKQAQELGFSLNEVALLLSNNGAAGCADVHDLLDKKLSELDEKIRRMGDFREKLTGYLAKCEQELEKHPESSDCPVIIEIAHRQAN